MRYKRMALYFLGYLPLYFAMRYGPIPPDEPSFEALAFIGVQGAYAFYILFDQAWRRGRVMLGVLSLCAWVFGLDFVTAYWRSYEDTKIAAVVAFVVLIVLTARACWLVVRRERVEVAGKH